MKRHFAIGLIFCLMSVCVAANATAAGIAKSRLVAERDAQAAGLTRAWFAQATLDREREEVTSATLQDGVVFITTTGGVLQAIDAENGTTLWTVNVGREYLTAPAINSKIVAVLCGTRLVVYDRFSGKFLDETEVMGQPSAAPVATEREIYVPTYSQRLYAYPVKRREAARLEAQKALESMLEATKDVKMADEMKAKLEADYAANGSKQYLLAPLDETRPHQCPTLGVAAAAPILGTQSYEVDRMIWTTDQGWLMIGELQRDAVNNPLQLLYKLQATPQVAYVNESRLGNRFLAPNDDVSSAPFYVPQDISAQNMTLEPARRKGGLAIVGVESGSVFAINDANGKVRWTYLTQSPVRERVSAFKDFAATKETVYNVYVPVESGDFFALDMKTGLENWRAAGVKRLISASATRLYVFDQLDRLAVLDRANGARLKTLALSPTKFQIFNRETDRVYLVSADGLVQCLRETQQVEPLRHREETCADVAARLAKAVETGSEEAPKAVAPSVGEAAPSADVADEEVAEDDPFADDSEATDESADEETAEDDPFADDSEATDESADEETAEDDPFADDSEATDESADEDDPFGGDDEIF
ncbi:MAG: PQQ-binding-like beta-propeller repeat protein [Thermoguttaceae bacterium]|nr:PQQ-binding-like beta-propeller repeat protein [Thermoguttaceae bacterium]